MSTPLRNLWNAISSLLAGTGPRAESTHFDPGCSLYLHEDGTWIFPQNVLGGAGGGVYVTVSPPLRVEAVADPTVLGNAVLTCMSRSRLENVAPGETWRPRDVAKDAGFKSNADLERGARLLSVHRKGDNVTVTAWAAAAGGGYVPAPGGERTCAPEVSAIGNLIHDLSRLCVPHGSAKSRRKADTRSSSAAKSGRGDSPQPFGYKMQWLAVPSSDANAVAEELSLRELRPCTWPEGIKAAHDDEGVFLTPPLDGWTIAAGKHPEARDGALLALLEKLSARFGSAFYFGTHRVVDYHAWARAENGRIQRAFAFLGESGEIVLNVGAPSPEEIELDTGTEDPENAPNEETVLELAGKWVLDPRDIGDRNDADGPGLLGKR